MPFPIEVFEGGKVVEKMAESVVTQAGGRPDQYVKIDGALYERYAENPMQWVKSKADPNVIEPAAPVTSSSEPQGTALNGDQMRPGEAVPPSEAKGVVDAVARGEIVGHGKDYDEEAGMNARDNEIVESVEEGEKEHEEAIQEAQEEARKAEKKQAAKAKPAAKAPASKKSDA
jgi:hypothetical protein